MTKKDKTPAALRAEAVILRRRANWPHLSQTVPTTKARWLPRLRRGGGQRG